MQWELLITVVPIENGVFRFGTSTTWGHLCHRGCWYFSESCFPIWKVLVVDVRLSYDLVRVEVCKFLDVFRRLLRKMLGEVTNEVLLLISEDKWSHTLVRGAAFQKLTDFPGNLHHGIYFRWDLLCGGVVVMLWCRHHYWVWEPLLVKGVFRFWLSVFPIRTFIQSTRIIDVLKLLNFEANSRSLSSALRGCRAFIRWDRTIITYDKVFRELKLCDHFLTKLVDL